MKYETFSESLISAYTTIMPTLLSAGRTELKRRYCVIAMQVSPAQRSFTDVG